MATPIPKTSAPAARALSAAGITSLEQVAQRTEAEISALHGVGPKVVRILAAALETHGLRFRENEGGDLRHSGKTPGVS